MSSVATLRLSDLGLPVVTRAQWGTKYETLYQKRRQEKAFTGVAKYAFSHISVTVDDGTLTGDFQTDMRELERIGYERFGSGISYNWAIDLATGMIGEGQPLDAKGTHTVNDKNIKGYPYNLNYFGHAIVAIGMPGDQPTNKFVTSFAAILAVEQELGLMVKNAPLLPHSLFANKECPTEAIRDRLGEIWHLVPTIGKIHDMDFNDKVGSIKDPDGSPLIVSEALIRGNWAYMERMGLIEQYNKANGIKK